MEIAKLEILIIENNLGDLRLITEMLDEITTIKFYLSHVDRLSKASEYLESKTYDLILVDLILPDGYGLDTLIIVQKQNPEIPIIVLTGLDDEDLATSALHHGAQDYLVKGQFNSKLLLKSILFAVERKKMEYEIIKAQKLDSIGMLAGGIAHEFNNILTSIMGNISLAKLNLSNNKLDKVYDNLLIAAKACDSAKGVSHQLLTYAKGGSPIKKTVSIVPILKESVDLSLAGSNVRCEFSIQESLYPVEIDETQICQVFNNLLINSKQAMQEGGTIYINVENCNNENDQHDFLHQGNYIKLSIHDKGDGIPEDNLQKIFEPFFSTKTYGIGLGLTTCSSIIKQHDGLITVDSQLGKETTFNVYLPALPNNVMNEYEQDHDLIIRNGRVLIMDDNVLIKDIIKEKLLEVGYDTEFAFEAYEAIEKYKKARYYNQPFDAVILDLIIPGGMGGKEVLAKLIEIDPKTKAIAISGYSDDPAISDCVSYGFKSSIGKPFDLDELCEVLHKVINQ